MTQSEPMRCEAVFAGPSGRKKSLSSEIYPRKPVLFWMMWCEAVRSGTAVDILPGGAESLELLCSILRGLKTRAAVRWTEQGEGAPRSLGDVMGALHPASTKPGLTHSVA